MNKTTIGTVTGFVVVLGVIVWLAAQSSGGVVSPSAAPAASGAALGAGTLTVEGESSYDFGTLKMAAGKVNYEWRVRNTGSEPVVITKLYTSCMCTSAALTAGGERSGPFGMPGHGFVPRINRTLRPNEAGVIEVVFDPAAHGPAGIGPARRSVIVEQGSGRPLELQFTAVVTP